MSTTDRQAASGTYVEARPSDYEESSGDGWVTFAGTMLLIAGTLNIIDGIVLQSPLIQPSSRRTRASSSAA